MKGSFNEERTSYKAVYTVEELANILSIDKKEIVKFLKEEGINPSGYRTEEGKITTESYIKVDKEYTMTLFKKTRIEEIKNENDPNNRYIESSYKEEIIKDEHIKNNIPLYNASILAVVAEGLSQFIKTSEELKHYEQVLKETKRAVDEQLWTIRDIEQMLEKQGQYISVKDIQNYFFREGIKPIKTIGRTNYYKKDAFDYANFKEAKQRRRTPDKETTEFAKSFIEDGRKKGLTNSQIVTDIGSIGRTKWFKELLK